MKKIKYDLNRTTVCAALGLAGLRPVTQIAIDETWSALRGRDPELVVTQRVTQSHPLSNSHNNN